MIVLPKSKRKNLQEKMDFVNEKLEDIPDWVFFPLPVFIFGGLVSLWLVKENALNMDSLQRLFGIAGNSPIIWLAGGLWILNKFLVAKDKDYDPAKNKIIRPRKKVKILERKLRIKENELIALKSGSKAQNNMLVACMKKLRSYDT